jgi:hypothetical protein
MPPPKKANLRSVPSHMPTQTPSKQPLDPLLEGPFKDNFERAMLGQAWRSISGSWKIENGKLCGRRARNRGVWLANRLPTNVRIEFDAVSDSDDGDLKVEAWGDGLSGATGLSYTNATSYLLIFGGWKNSLHVLARLNEHGADRLVNEVNPNDGKSIKERPVEKGKNYHFVIERADGKTLRWLVDGQLIHVMIDEHPLQGIGHDHFGFNDWDVHVCFDNFSIVPLN